MSLCIVKSNNNEKNEKIFLKSNEKMSGCRLMRNNIFIKLATNHITN